MNEIYADAYQMTGETKYLNAAKRFSHRDLFDSLANRVDNLDNKHANTQVPKVVGYQRIAELSGDGRYDTAARFKLLVRYPGWVGAGEMKVTCNGENYAAGAPPASYVVIDRKWKDGTLLAEENIADKWKESKWKDVEYDIPADMLKDKATVTVTFQSRTGSVAGGVYHIRLLKPKE